MLSRSSVSRIRFRLFRFFENGFVAIHLEGTSEPIEPAPEPSTIVLTLVGGAAIAGRSVRSGRSAPPSRTIIKF
ncbi:MAG: hypothetical protein DMF84_14115 [Acidobacteria bacterium]|nr:MAG: hypothetical protein DMF84_14115 [Acidobacteriota bacterium]